MIAQQLLNGLVSGSVFALFALGFTIVFGTHKILNLAHGGVFTAGAFIGYFAVIYGLPLWVAAILAMIFAFNATAGLVALSSLAVFVRRSGSELAGALTALAGAFFIGIAGAAYSGVVMSSFLTEYIPGSGATPEAQSAVIQGLYAFPQTFSGLAATAFAAWQIIAALSRAFPRWITIVNLVLASLSLGTYFIGFSVGIILVIPYLLAVGIWALRRSRRA